MNTGEKAPDFSLQDTTGKSVSLYNDLLGKGNQVVLLFFPLAFSSTCTEELCKVRDNMKMYNAFNARVAGISIDSFFTLREFKKSQNISFTLLSDFNKEVCRLYEVIYEDYHGMKGVSKRASFVIDIDGTIKHREVVQDSGRLPDFKAIQSALRT